MPLKRAASNHTCVESFNYWGSRRFLSRRIKRRPAFFEICEGLGMRAVGLLLYGNLRFGRNKEFRRSLQTAENLNNAH